MRATSVTGECDLGMTGLEPVPTTIVIFGATGDLAIRKIYPALHNRAYDGALPRGTRIIGIGRKPLDDAGFADLFFGACRDCLRDGLPPGNDHVSTRMDLAAALSYIRGDLSDPDVYTRLGAALAGPGMPGSTLFYLAVAPDLFGTIARNLADAGLGTAHATEASDGRTRTIVVEKPFGRDRASAASLSALLQECFAERDIFRIDHYLGKETVQNLLYLRFANAIFEPLWNRNHIESITIDVFETKGIGTRGGYYDRAGAARDMLQNHLLQLLCLIAMEPPSSLDPEAVRDEKIKVLRAIPRYSVPELALRSVRGQYGAGRSAEGSPIPGYLEEEKVSPGSRTETYVALEIELDNWRFSGVPITLRTGKAMDRDSSEIRIDFRRPPATLYAAHCGELLCSNRLRLRIQPDDGVWLSFNAKVPGKSRVRNGELAFSYSGAKGRSSLPEAYERLLGDALAGDSTLFIRADESDEAWRLVDALERAWATDPDIPLVVYPAGSPPIDPPRRGTGT